MKGRAITGHWACAVGQLAACAALTAPPPHPRSQLAAGSHPNNKQLPMIWAAARGRNMQNLLNISFEG